MLDSYSDCALRSAVNYYPELFAEFGYNLNETKQHVGAAVGSGTHTSICHTLKTVQAGDKINISDSTEVGILKLREEAEQGLQYDEVTPKCYGASELQNAENTVGVLHRSWLKFEGFRSVPRLVETKLIATLPNGKQLSGHIDQFLDPARLIDIKTGKREYLHPMQLGGYNITLEANNLPVQQSEILYLKRMKVGSDPELPKLHAYDSKLAYKVAWQQANRISRDLDRFIETQDASIFPINLNSFLCSARFCKAWKTNACPASKFKKDATT